MVKNFEPYTIKHISITAIAQQELPIGNTLCYFWWKQVPLGHLWTSKADIFTVISFRGKVMEVVAPAINNYIERLGIEFPEPEWCKFFLDGAIDKLEDVLDKYLGEQVLRSDDSSKPISVVICTRNRASFLEVCIKSLLDSSDKNFELVVVDNASDDDSTKEVVAQFPTVKYIYEPRKGLDIARNTGARSATYSIVAYTDDDVTIEKDWVRKIKSCFDDPMTMAVTGQVFPVELRTQSQYIFERYWGFNKGYKPVVFDHKYFNDFVAHGVPVWDIGAGANMAFRREVFDLVGWFDERLDVGAAGCSGDSEFWYRILAEGWNCYYFPQVYVYHSHRETDKALISQIFNYMRGQVASLMVQYENYGHRGNLLRVKKLLPAYYLSRLVGGIRKRDENFGTIYTEIKGCISGWQFYKSVKENRRKDIPVHNEQLKLPVTVSAETLVSVIISCYNYGNYLGEAIESVYNQTCKNVEIIVVDDGSTDNTQEVIKQYPAVRAVTVSRVGLSATRNIGIEYCKGDFVIFLDADDYLYPNAIELNLYYFSYYPLSAFISGGHDRVDGNRNFISSEMQEEHLGENYFSLLQGNYIGMEGSVMYRRELFPSFHFDTKLMHCEDYDINLRIAKLYPTFSHSEKIAAYRMHGKNMSRDKSKMLETVRGILARLDSNADSKEEKNAIAEGLLNWKKYYGES